ncbi:glycosyltransferase [Mixta intestinalis]|jgi:colanic acid/amylovoran biosynthesis glycosyltransferase|uniref:Alpha-D-kanosaminyltransferase n=1 Tax=Mixta intestinalis TaxID=1615494 RepID=A0A6P1Q170_9GAMM|nr:glycosyltransferase [Mixta intestinalis]QHM71994.1 Alpha-D-kanosaminyltransferase [Mixta intestinalis]
MHQERAQNQGYIGYVLKRYPRFSETFVVNEILAHERSGLKIDIFALGPVEEAYFQDGIARVRAPVTRLADKQRSSEAYWTLWQQASQALPDFTTRMSVLYTYSVHEVAQALMLALAVRERGIRHLHAHFATRATTVARLAAKLSGISYSFTAHAKDIYFPYEKPTQIELKLRDALRAITVSDYNLDYLQSQSPMLAGKVTRIYNGLDLTQFTYLAPRQRPRHILAIGRLVPKKGFHVLIDALHILRARNEAFTCTLTGDGPLYPALAAHIQRLGLSDCVTLSGSRPQPEIKTAIQRSAMVVAPSVISEEGDRDGLPTVLLESMALGTPVVSTEVAGIPELVSDGGTGLCVAPDDPLALADAMQRLLNNPALQLSLALQARHRIEERFDIDRNSARMREIFACSGVNNAATPSLLA